MSPTLRIYYLLKPLMPWRLRNLMRTYHANRIRRRSSSIWPIAPGSETPPSNWQGWPDGKRFAVVLTHDIEGQSGYDKCRKLAGLERRCGFRSSFNFVPEGEYVVEEQLRRDLESQGFEIGVHGLHHDGKLYDSFERFSQRASRINHYLREWNAVGFRSPLMHHNLEWLQQLNVEYDLSTFDTDPFEPQPDPLGTIFPKWIPNRSTLRPPALSESNGPPSDLFELRSNPEPACSERAEPVEGRPPPSALRPPSSALRPPNTGYVELPYTLPQDSSLFLVLRETTPEIWIQKLDWLAENGGMALINTHPDYMRFPGEKASSYTYPVDHYEAFLNCVATKYAGLYHHALPRDLARWYRRSIGEQRSEA